MSNKTPSIELSIPVLIFVKKMTKQDSTVLDFNGLMSADLRLDNKSSKFDLFSPVTIWQCLSDNDEGLSKSSLVDPLCMVSYLSCSKSSMIIVLVTKLVSLFGIRFPMVEL